MCIKKKLITKIPALYGRDIAEELEQYDEPDEFRDAVAELDSAEIFRDLTVVNPEKDERKTWLNIEWAGGSYIVEWVESATIDSEVVV